MYVEDVPVRVCGWLPYEYSVVASLAVFSPGSCSTNCSRSPSASYV
ncbi:hypothetical protein ACFRI7_25705 [Streptomyces sp. NPDC056716]